MEDKKYVSYPVSYTNEEVSKVVGLLEYNSRGIDRDLLITALLVFVIGLSDPEVLEDEARFQGILESISNHICWALGSAVQKLDPKDYN